MYGRGSHLVHVTQMPRTKFRSPYPRRLHIKFGFENLVSEKKIFENGGWTTDGRRTDDRPRLDGYTVSSLREPNGSGELIRS